MTKRYSAFLVLVLLAFSAFAQYEGYGYKRQIEGAETGWQKLTLPNAIFGKVSRDFSDLRIIGVSASGDTVQVPYLLDLKKEKLQEREIRFKLINKTSRNKNTFFTFLLPDERILTSITLDFGRKNFDWRVDLDGSNDQLEWFSIQKDYRLVGIRNTYTDYRFTTLHFSPTQYKYYRIRIRDEWFAFFRSAKLIETYGEQGVFRKYAATVSKQIENEKDRTSGIWVDLAEEVPISQLTLSVADTIDFVRPVTVEYLLDSIQTEKGWKYNYAHLFSGVLSSYEEAKFKFANTITRKLRITVRNHDNAPLDFSVKSVKGNVYNLLIRFPDSGTFYLLYGNELASAPEYDLHYFKNNIPRDLSEVFLAAEEATSKKNKQPSGSFSKVWLWLVIVLVGSMLAFFALRMMKQEAKGGDVQ